MISPSWSFRRSGMPWQMTSLIELRLLVRRDGSSNWAHHVQANRFGKVSVAQRRWIRISLDRRLVDNLIQFVGGDTRSHMGCSNVENFSRYLQRGCWLYCLHRGRGRPALQAFRTPSCSSLVRICGGCPDAVSSRLGIPGPDRKLSSGI